MFVYNTFFNNIFNYKYNFTNFITFYKHALCQIFVFKTNRFKAIDLILKVSLYHPYVII